MKRENGIRCLDLRSSKDVASYCSAWPPSPEREDERKDARSRRGSSILRGLSMWRERTMHASFFVRLKRHAV